MHSRHRPSRMMRRTLWFSVKYLLGMYHFCHSDSPSSITYYSHFTAKIRDVKKLGNLPRLGRDTH